MKCLAIILFLSICTSMFGCSTVAHFMQGNYIEQPGNEWTKGAIVETHAGSFQVYRNNPYALHLEFEEINSQGELNQLNGDGGASLNAYAACLTLKVIF